MKAEEIPEMSKTVDKAKELLGLITVVKGRIARLEQADQELNILYSKPRDSSIDLQREIPIGKDTHEAIRKLVLECSSNELVRLQTELGNLTWPMPIQEKAKSVE